VRIPVVLLFCFKFQTLIALDGTVLLFILHTVFLRIYTRTINGKLTHN